MKKTISIIGIVGVPANNGGFETLADNLVRHPSTDTQYTVYCSSKRYEQKITEYNGAEIHYIPFDANGPQSIIYDILSIIRAAFKGEGNLLILGVSGCIVLPIIKFIWGKKIKIITNIDGLEWKRDKWGRLAKKYLKFSERIAVNFSDEIVADNLGIAQHVNESYNKDAKVIAYGGDHTQNRDTEIDVTTIIKFNAGEYAFSLCRIEPENNIHLIFKSFENLNENLVFVGNWNNSQYGKNLRDKYADFPHIQLLDPIYNENKLFALRHNCKIYLHGHSAGGTNPSLVEMMFVGKPMACFDCNYNRYTTNLLALYFSNSDELSSIISQKKWENMNEKNLKDYAEKEYTWRKICAEYEALFV